MEKETIKDNGQEAKQTVQEWYPFSFDMWNIGVGFEIFARSFQAVKDKETPELPEGNRIKGEVNLANGRTAEIIVMRYREIIESQRWVPFGSITLKGEDLRQKGIEYERYSLGREIVGIGAARALRAYIFKGTLRTGKKEADVKKLSPRNRKELNKADALIEELSDKFPTLPEANKVISTGAKRIIPKPKEIFRGK